jgi:ferrous iron transport protein A
MRRDIQTLDKLSDKTKAIAYGFTDDSVGSRLSTMGLVPGSQLEFVRLAPLRRTLYIKVDGIRMALRREEAAAVLIML